MALMVLIPSAALLKTDEESHAEFSNVISLPRWRCESLKQLSYLGKFPGSHFLVVIQKSYMMSYKSYAIS